MRIDQNTYLRFALGLTSVAIALIFIFSGCGSGARKLSKGAQLKSFSHSESREIPVYVWEMDREMVCLDILILGGTQNYPFPYQGLESLALQTAIESGPSNLGSERYKEALDLLNCEISVRSDLQGSVIHMTCPGENFGRSFRILCDILLDPAFEGQIFEEIKTRERLLRMREATDNGATAWEKAHQNFFNDGNFSKNPSGTPESLKRIEFKEAKEFYKTLIGKERIAIVASGPLELDFVEHWSDSLLKVLPQGYYESEKQSLPILDAHQVQKHSKKTGSNFIIGLMPGPEINSKEAASFYLGMQILNYRLQVMTSKDFPMSSSFAGISATNPGYGMITLRTNSGRESIYALVDSVKTFFLEGPSETEFNLFKNRYRLLEWENMASPEGMTSSASEMLLQGVYPSPGSKPSMLESVKLSEVQKAIKTYTRHINWTFVGDASNLGSGPLEEAFE